MIKCVNCQKKVYEGKHRSVDVHGERKLLCGECGRVTFTTPDGEKAQGLVQAISMPIRKKNKGRNISLFVERELKKGDVLRETTFEDLPGKAIPGPCEYKILGIRSLDVLETVEAPGESKGKKPRKRKKRVGFSVRAFSC